MINRLLCLSRLEVLGDKAHHLVNRSDRFRAHLISPLSFNHIYKLLHYIYIRAFKRALQQLAKASFKRVRNNWRAARRAFCQKALTNWLKALTVRKICQCKLANFFGSYLTSYLNRDNTILRDINLCHTFGDLNFWLYNIT